MPSKKRKYNARFPAGRIKKIMQTDEEVGKVAQAVPIIISRTLELFVESLLSKAMQVTVARNAKTLSPSHVKQCILAESRFDFLRDLVKNIPDVSAAEEKEMMSAESSPNSSRFSDAPMPSSCEVKLQLRDHIKRSHSSETELPNRTVKTETITSTTIADAAIDLTKKTLDEKPLRTANFYQETLITEEVQHNSVIKVNPSYSSPQPSTSYNPESVARIELVPKTKIPFVEPLVTPLTPVTPRTPVTPILNIDFSKNLGNPEIKVLDTAVANVLAVPKAEKNPLRVHRQHSKPKVEVKKIEIKPLQPHPVDIDILNSGNLQIDEDYDT